MLKRLFERYGKKKVLAVIALVVVLVVYGLSSVADAPATEVVTTNPREVEVTTPALLSGNSTVSLIGTVRPQSEVKITNERGGKVTSVQTALGKSVSAGQILVTLENNSERASLLQAEGAYEAAVANSASSDSGLREAKSRYEVSIQNAISSNDSAYITFTDVLYNSVDDFFSNPTTGVPGLRIVGYGQTEFMNSERVAFRSLTADWTRNVSNNISKDDLVKILYQAKDDTQRLLKVVDIIVPLLQDKENDNDLPAGSITSLSAEVTISRNKLVGSINALDNAVSNLNSAEEALARANISAGGGQASISDAQVKQALGSLRAAQANYEKTLLRSPISGTVNAFDVKVGAYLNAFSNIATIANNNALEIVVFASDKERDRLSIGDELSLGENVATGTVVSIAPAIDAVSKKTEVRIAVEGDAVKSGETVRIEKAGSDVVSDGVRIPLTAVKFTSTAGNIFVVENDTLVAKSVELGEVVGSNVEIVSGMDASTEFVVDARGHNVGEKVVVITK